MELVIIQKKIFVIRGQRVMIDQHLAELYGVPTKSLNLAIKRNIKKFPADFMFQLNEEEFQTLRFQIETSKTEKRGGRRFLPYAFTEHGITMLSSVLRSPTAIDVNIAVVRAFIFLKQYSNDFKLLQKQMHEMESRFNRKFDNINEIIEYLISKPEPKEEKPKPKKQIGFRIARNKK